MRSGILFLHVYQRRYKMATEVYNWVQKYDADLAAGEKTITEASKQNGVSLHCGDSVESE